MEVKKREVVAKARWWVYVRFFFFFKKNKEENNPVYLMLLNVRMYVRPYVRTYMHLHTASRFEWNRTKDPSNSHS